MVAGQFLAAVDHEQPPAEKEDLPDKTFSERLVLMLSDEEVTCFIVSDHSPPSSNLSFHGVKQIQVPNSALDFLLHQQGASNVRNPHTLASTPSPQL